jgi:dienelactone hydrolase
MLRNSTIYIPLSENLSWAMAEQNPASPIFRGVTVSYFPQPFIICQSRGVMSVGIAEHNRRRSRMATLIRIDSHGTAIQAEMFTPTVPNGGTVIVAHGSDGMTEPWAAMIREYATELAGKGFTALIPEYFGKTGTIPGSHVFSEIPTRLHHWQEATSDTVVFAKTLHGISASRVGLLGFSLGGHLCLRLREETTALVEYFAPELPELGGIGSAKTPAPHVQLHHGLADLLVPYSNAEAIAATLKEESTASEIFSYEGAGHGFAGADPNNATARRSSKDRTLAFFEKYLE